MTRATRKAHSFVNHYISDPTYYNLAPPAEGHLSGPGLCHTESDPGEPNEVATPSPTAAAPSRAALPAQGQSDPNAPEPRTPQPAEQFSLPSPSSLAPAPGPHRRVFILRLMSPRPRRWKRKQERSPAPSSIFPHRLPKTKRQETKSHFFTSWSLFFQRFQGQQSQCGEACGEKTARDKASD